MSNEIEKIKVTPTDKIEVNQNDTFEDEMRELTREELLYRLANVETDPENIKIIKKVLKSKPE